MELCACGGRRPGRPQYLAALVRTTAADRGHQGRLALEWAVFARNESRSSAPLAPGPKSAHATLIPPSIDPKRLKIQQSPASPLQLRVTLWRRRSVRLMHQE